MRKKFGIQPHTSPGNAAGRRSPGKDSTQRRILPSTIPESSFPSIFSSPLLAGQSAKGGFNSTDASNHYPSDVLQVQCVLQPVLTAARTLVPDIITDI